MSDGWGSGFKAASELQPGRDLVLVSGEYVPVWSVKPGGSGWTRVTTSRGVFFHIDEWPVQWLGVVEADEARA